MNSKKAFLISCIISSSIVTTAVQAASFEAGVNACMDALQIHLEKSDKKVNVSLNSTVDMPKARLSQLQILHLDTINLDSPGPDTKADYATVNCVVNNRARVKRLSFLPIKAPNTSGGTISL
jgi:hypothetical protein